MTDELWELILDEFEAQAWALRRKLDAEQAAQQDEQADAEEQAA